MTFHLCGMDEAGYGPTLGPLVVGMATLRHDDRIAPAIPWKILAPTVVKRRGARGLSVADSKSLHKPSKGDLSPLEAGVLSFITCERGETPGTFRELIRHLTQDRDQYLDEYPWYRGQDLQLPHSVNRLELVGSSRRLQRRLEGSGLAIEEIRALPLEVIEFNRGLIKYNSKGEVNAQSMGRFLNWMWRQDSRKSIEVWTDRLGGRQRYGPFLHPLFPGAEFKIVEQNEEHQIYRVSSEGREMTIHFNKECEDLSFTTALASMTAKYVRELHMALFNRWWQEHDASLKATAGYPLDARRFLDDIRPLQKRLGIDPALLIRQR